MKSRMMVPSKKHEVVIPPPLVARGSIVDTDPCQAELSVQPWQLMISPLKGSEFLVKREYLSTPKILMYTEFFDKGVKQTGATVEDTFTLVVPLYNPDNSLYYDRVANPNEILAGPNSIVDVAFGDQHSHLIFMIDNAVIRNNFSSDDYFTASSRVNQRWHLADGEARASLVKFSTALLQQPQWQYPALGAPSAVDQLENDIVEIISQVLNKRGAWTQGESSSIRKKGFERVVDFLFRENNSEKTPSISKLCGIGQVSQRTLEYAFREYTGLTPKRFLKIRSYHMLRRRLIEEASPASVQEVSMQLGLYELGRVAGEYRSLFGEYPSETLQKNYVSSAFPNYLR